MHNIKESYSNIFTKLKNDQFSTQILDIFHNSLESAFDPNINGNLKKWIPVYNNVPDIIPESLTLNADAPAFRRHNKIDESLRNFLYQELQKLHPWRKGPFSLFGIDIIAEWRSNLKWKRVMKSNISFKDKNILDIGSGNGYYLFRMLGEGAKSVIGADPGLLSVIQFKIFQTYFDAYNNRKNEYGCADIFPVPFEVIPENSAHFDIIFSMGVLYHRKNPEKHLKQIFSLLAPNGTLFLETLIIENQNIQVLQPEGRYAQMRNVFKIPNISTLLKWLQNTGYDNLKVIDISKTTLTEQRSTSWMTFHSLKDFLDLDNPEKTIEGHPAPVRVLITAQNNYK
jgi:tRNA (mo5U34)-methyltransferase